MDQRNAGRSRGPVRGDHGWHTYTADQLAVMDHLGVHRFHVAGMCIGGPYALGLIEAAPERVASAVLFQPIGRDDNRSAFYEMFDGWAAELKATHPEATDEDWQRFRENMYGGDKVLFNVDEDFLKRCETPLLVLKGNDLYHPESTSRLVAELAPNAELIEEWKTSPAREEVRRAVREFLRRQTP